VLSYGRREPLFFNGSTKRPLPTHLPLLNHLYIVGWKGRSKIYSGQSPAGALSGTYLRHWGLGFRAVPQGQCHLFGVIEMSITQIYVDEVRSIVEDQQRHQSRLIAAAPELLVVAKALDALIEHQYSGSNAAVSALQDAALKARAAIAKVTGE
jgi:hypothetical protein